jgi:hypothetical protein
MDTSFYDAPSPTSRPPFRDAFDEYTWPEPTSHLQPVLEEADDDDCILYKQREGPRVRQWSIPNVISQIDEHASTVRRIYGSSS